MRRYALAQAADPTPTSSSEEEDEAREPSPREPSPPREHVRMRTVVKPDGTSVHIVNGTGDDGLFYGGRDKPNYMSRNVRLRRGRSRTYPTR